MTIKKSFLKNSPVFLSVVAIELLTYWSSCAQGVGIGTNNPQETLHVAGTIRIDSTHKLLENYRVAAFDSSGTVGWIESAVSGEGGLFFAANDSLFDTSDPQPQTWVTLTIPPGTYLLFAQCEVRSGGYMHSTRMVVTDGSVEFANSIPFSIWPEYSPWSMMSRVTYTAPQTIYLKSGARNGGSANMRNAWLAALKVE